jgi:autotransporter-associated beta strand protein
MMRRSSKRRSYRLLLAAAITLLPPTVRAQQLLTTESFSLPSGPNNTDSDFYQEMIVGTSPVTVWAESGADGLQGAQSIHPSGSGFVNTPASTLAFKFNVGAIVDSLNATYGAGHWTIAQPTLSFQYTYYANNAIFGGGAGSFETYWVANDSWSFGNGAPATQEPYADNLYDAVPGTDAAYAANKTDLASWAGSLADLGSTNYNWLGPSDNPNYFAWKTAKSGPNQGMLTTNLSADPLLINDVTSATAGSNPNVSLYLIPNSPTLGLTIFTGGGDVTPTFSFNVFSTTVSHASSTWVANGSGTWETAANWQGNTYPSGAGQVATFGDSIGMAASATVTLGSNETVGAINFNSASGNSYTIAASSPAMLILDNAGAGATITLAAQAGDSVISAPIRLNDNATFSIAIGRNLDCSGGISSTGSQGITKTGAGTLTLSGTDIFNGSTNVMAGTLVLASSASLPAGTQLSIADGAEVTVFNAGAPNSNLVLQAGSITADGTGRLDLNNNALILHASTLAAVNALLQSGFAAGTWSGAGIDSSSAAGNAVTALGVLLNNNGIGETLVNSFEGQPTVLNDVLVKYTYYGDTNLDGTVDGSDYSRIDNGYLTNATGWFNGDFNYDGVINGSDYTLIDNAYNTQGAAYTADVNSTAEVAPQIWDASTVPEPAMMTGFALLLGIPRRRRYARTLGAKRGTHTHLRIRSFV